MDALYLPVPTYSYLHFRRPWGAEGSPSNVQAYNTSSIHPLAGLSFLLHATRGPAWNNELSSSLAYIYDCSLCDATLTTRPWWSMRRKVRQDARPYAARFKTLAGDQSTLPSGFASPLLTASVDDNLQQGARDKSTARRDTHSLLSTNLLIKHWNAPRTYSYRLNRLTRNYCIANRVNLEASFTSNSINDNRPCSLSATASGHEPRTGKQQSAQDNATPVRGRRRGPACEAGQVRCDR